MPTAYNKKTGELLVLQDDGQWVKPTIVKNPETGEKLYHDGSAWKPTPLSEREEFIGQTAAIAQGASGGVGDEFLAGVDALYNATGAKSWEDYGNRFNNIYDKNLNEIRAAEKRYMANDPAGYITRAGVGGLPLALATAPKTAATTLSQAFGRGALWGGIAGFGGGEGGLESRAENIIPSAIGGGILSATLERAVVPAASQFVKWITAKQPQLIEEVASTAAQQTSAAETPAASVAAAPQVRLTEQGRLLAEKAGLNVNEISAELAREFAAKAKRAADPVQAAAAAEASTLPVPVKLTTGQINLFPEQQMLESEMAKGTYGPLAARTMTDAFDTQTQALRQNADAIMQRIGGIPGRGVDQRGQLVQGLLSQKEQAAARQVNNLYNAARQGGEAGLDPQFFRQAVQNIANDVAEQFSDASIPKVSGVIQGLIKQSTQPGEGSALVSNLFRVRRQLVSLQGELGVEGAAAGTAKKALDTHIIDSVNDAVMTGDTAAVSRWKDAIAARRNYGERFEGGDFVESLVEKTKFGSELKVDSNDAMNLIFGQGDVGFIGRRGMVRNLTKLRNQLGVDSAGWRALKEETFARFMRKAQGAQGPTDRGFSGAKLATAWEEAMQKNPEILQTIFTNEERALINQFIRVTKRVTIPVKGGQNFSNTNAAVMGVMKRFMTSTIMGPKIAEFLNNMPILAALKLGGLQDLANSARASAAAAGNIKAGAPPVQEPVKQAVRPWWYNDASRVRTPLAVMTNQIAQDKSN